MTKEFNLSEKIQEGVGNNDFCNHIIVRDVKKFIKRLKESRSLTFKDGKCFFIMEKDLNKLAGEELSK